MPVSYEYIFLMMINSVIKFDNRGYININDIPNYIDKYLELAKKNVIDVYEEDIDFIEEDLEEQLDAFLVKYGYFVQREGDYLTIDIKRPEILESIIRGYSIENPGYIIFSIDYENYELLKTIGATFVYDEYKKIIEIEKQLEQAYFDYYSNPNKDNSKKLYELMQTEKGVRDSIDNLSNYFFEGLKRANKYSMLGNELKYDKRPVKVREYKSFINGDFEEFEDVFLEEPMYAIFGKGSLSYEEMNKTININHYKRKEKDIYKIKEEFIKYDRIVFMQYIKNIDKCLESVENLAKRENLLRIKSRLMYVIDSPELCLYKPENFDKYYRDNINNKIELSIYKECAQFLAGELFCNKEKRCVTQKLLFIKTYYDLTHDEELVLEFMSFSNLPNFDKYKNIIFGKEFTLML